MTIEKYRPRCFIDVEVNNQNLGRIIIELFSDICPKTCENFRALCTGEKGIGSVSGQPLHYKGVPFHRIIKNFIIQSGDFIAGNGTGGESIYGGTFKDENFTLVHDKCFLLSMANRGPDTNGSQFFITTQPSPHLDGKHTVFGHVISGFDVLARLENEKTDKNNKPLREIKISNCGELVLKVKPKATKRRPKSDSEGTADSEESEEQEKKKKRHSKPDKKEKKEERREKLVSAVQKPVKYDDATESTLVPAEIPEVPVNNFLMRRSPPTSMDRNRRFQGRSDSYYSKRPPVSKSGRKIKGRGFMRYRTPSPENSRSGSETPPHWRQAQLRVCSMTELAKKKQLEEKEISVKKEVESGEELDNQDVSQRENFRESQQSDGEDRYNVRDRRNRDDREPMRSRKFFRKTDFDEEEDDGEDENQSNLRSMVVKADNRSFDRESGNRSFDREGGNRSFDREGGNRSFDREGNRSFDREGGNRSFDREGGNRSFDREGGNRSFDREGGNRSFDREGGNRSFDREGGNRSFDRESGNRYRRMLDRSERPDSNRKPRHSERPAEYSTRNVSRAEVHSKDNEEKSKKEAAPRKISKSVEVKRKWSQMSSLEKMVGTYAGFQPLSKQNADTSPKKSDKPDGSKSPVIKTNECVSYPLKQEIRTEEVDNPIPFIAGHSEQSVNNAINPTESDNFSNNAIDARICSYNESGEDSANLVAKQVFDVNGEKNFRNVFFVSNNSNSSEQIPLIGEQEMPPTCQEGKHPKELQIPGLENPSSRQPENVKIPLIDLEDHSKSSRADPVPNYEHEHKRHDKKRKDKVPPAMEVSLKSSQHGSNKIASMKKTFTDKRQERIPLIEESSFDGAPGIEDTAIKKTELAENNSLSSYHSWEGNNNEVREQSALYSSDTTKSYLKDHREDDTRESEPSANTHQIPFFEQQQQPPQQLQQQPPFHSEFFDSPYGIPLPDEVTAPKMDSPAKTSSMFIAEFKQEALEPPGTEQNLFLKLPENEPTPEKQTASGSKFKSRSYRRSHSRSPSKSPRRSRSPSRERKHGKSKSRSPRRKSRSPVRRRSRSNSRRSKSRSRSPARRRTRYSRSPDRRPYRRSWSRPYDRGSKFGGNFMRMRNRSPPRRSPERRPYRRDRSRRSRSHSRSDTEKRQRRRQRRTSTSSSSSSSSGSRKKDRHTKPKRSSSSSSSDSH